MSTISVRIQSILYNLEMDSLERSLEYIDNAARNARQSNVVERVDVAYGDCSSTPSISCLQLEEFQRRFSNINRIEYKHFSYNLGHGGGQNSLAEGANTDFIMALNPDALLLPRLLEEMLRPATRPDIGLVDARQLPSEHPKEYDSQTGETGWASGACALISRKLFQQLGGFDANTFFLYCDDVDLSWRVRLAGFKVVHQPSAVVFHDKRLDAKGAWKPSYAERFYSAEAGLLLPYKFSRGDLTEDRLGKFKSAGDPVLRRAAAAFEERRRDNRLPIQIDRDHAVAEFVNGNYARQRFEPRF